MSREPHEIAILEWVELVLTGLDPLYTVAFSHGDQAAGAKPRAVVMMLSDLGVGTPEFDATDEPGDDTTRFQHVTRNERSFTFRVQLYAPGARAHARALELALEDEASDALFDAASIRIRHAVGGLADEHTMRSARWDAFAVVDFEGGFEARRVQEIAVIETVNLQSNAGALAGYDQTIDVSEG